MTEEKVEMVKENASTYGLNVTLEAIGLPKSTWHYWKKMRKSPQERYTPLKEPLSDVVREHPSYGFPRVQPELDARGYVAGEWRIRRGLQMWDLSLRRAVKPPKPSMPRQILSEKGLGLVHDLEDISPFDVLVTDFTELRYDNGRKKAYFMPLLDHYTKWVIGWSVGRHRDTEIAKEALTMTEYGLAEMGLSLEDRIAHHDQNPVYTGYRWLYQLLMKAKGRVSCSENGAKGNTVMEAFFGRFKTENESLFCEARNIWELRRIIGQQVGYHNCRRRHSALDYQTPKEVLNKEGIPPRPAVDLAVLSR